MRQGADSPRELLWIISTCASVCLSPRALLKELCIQYFHAVVSLLLGFLAETIGHVEHHVARKGVAPCLSAALGVYGACDIVKIAKEVEAVEHADYAPFEHGAGKTGVPYEVVGVQLTAFVATATIHSKVGGELEIQRQLKGGGETVVRDCRLIHSVVYA